MFEIHPAAEDKILVLAEKEALDLPVSAMVLWDRGEESGYLLYRVENDTAELLVCRCGDADLQEWLVRAALNAAANRNALTAVCHNNEMFACLQKLGFASQDGCLSAFIPDFFNRPCQGCAGGC